MGLCLKSETRLPNVPAIVKFLLDLPPPAATTLAGSSARDGSDNNGDLGILNLTTVPNGVYDLILLVRGGGDQVSTPLRIAIENALKIGQFSFREQDLITPVNGIPL